MLTFNPPLPPQPGTGESVTFRILKARFGDGYEQRAADGLNADLASPVTLAWGALTAGQAKEIIGFMKARGGVEAFLYTLPGEDFARQFTVVSYDRRDAAGNDTLTVVLREVPDL